MAKDVITRFKADVGNYDANIAKARRQLEGFKNDNLSAGGVLKQLSGNLMSAATRFASVGAAIGGALKVTKDALMASEATVDEWGRLVASTQSVYEGFLSSINNGDISGYLGRIDQIVAAARSAYDELDRLGTMRTIQAPAMSRQEAENTRLRMMIQTGRWISPADGSNPYNLNNGDMLSPAQIKEIEAQLQNGINKIIDLTRNELDQTRTAIDAYYNKLAVQAGLSYDDFLQGVSSMAEFDKRVAGANQYASFEARRNNILAWANSGHSLTPEQSAIVNQSNPYMQYKGWDTFRIDKQGENSYNDLVNLIKQQQQQASNLYSIIGSSYRTMNRAEGITVKQLMGGAGGNGNLTDANTYTPAIGSIDAMVAKVKELQDEFNKAANQSIRDQLLPQLEAAQFYLESMRAGGPGKVELPSGDLSSRFLPDLSTAIQPIATDNSESLGAIIGKIMAEIEAEDVKPANDKSVFEKYNQAVSGFSQIASGFKQMGVDLPDEIESLLGVLQGLSSIIGGVSTIIEALGFGAMSANTIALSANTAALVALTSAVGTNTLFSFLPFAGGGVVKAAGGFEVPGNFNSLDQVPALLNSGEVVLNQAQAGVLAANLQNSGLANLHLETIFTGEMIRVLLNNNSRRTGRGSYVTTKAG